MNKSYAQAESTGFRRGLLVNIASYPQDPPELCTGYAQVVNR